jgi:hypothetical protein
MNLQSTFGIAIFVVAVVAFAGGLVFGALVERRQAASKAFEAELLRRSKPAVPPAVKPEWLKSTQPQPGTAGFTIAGALNGVGCLGRSRADEPVFVLCARDKAASMTVRDWADMAEKLGAKPEKVKDARYMADRMEAWREAAGGGKVPD